jgi:Ran GTPase-activating protein (RanGAP) involved in mRNA processing and transport
VATFLRQHDKVESLDLAENAFDGAAMHIICQALAKSSVRAVDFGSCGLTFEAACELANLAKTSKVLRELRLVSNPLGPAAVAAIADGLALSESVTVVDLEHTGMEEVGARALGEMLKRSETLTELHLRFNQIDASGCRALAQGVAANRSLKVLDLDANELGFEGLAELALTLTVNRHLEKLVLSNMPMTANGAAVLAQALLHNTTLTVLNLDGVRGVHRRVVCWQLIVRVFGVG